MESISTYYKMILQRFAWTLHLHKDTDLASQMIQEQSIEILENSILSIKDTYDEKVLYYYAGRSTWDIYMNVLYKTSIDDGNVDLCIKAMNKFEKFMGLIDDNE